MLLLAPAVIQVHRLLALLKTRNIDHTCLNLTVGSDIAFCLLSGFVVCTSRTWHNYQYSLERASDKMPMTCQERLTEKIQTLPPSLLPMVDVFVDFLLTHYQAEQTAADDLDVAEMAKLAMAGGAFDWLNDPGEDDIYCDEDGKPIGVDTPAFTMQ
ncbi:MAG: hypothetical protein ACOYNY_14370 [Caldilineaceae bacterium]